VGFPELLEDKKEKKMKERGEKGKKYKGVKVQCLDCGYIFRSLTPAIETLCPKCKGGNVEVDDYIPTYVGLLPKSEERKEQG